MQVFQKITTVKYTSCNVISYTIVLLLNADGPTVQAFPDYTYANFALTAWLIFISHVIPAKVTFRLSR